MENNKQANGESWNDTLPARMGTVAFGLVVFAMVTSVIYSVTGSQAPINPSIVNGTYRNLNCGSVTFNNGVATFGSENASYTLKQFKDDSLGAVTTELVGVQWDPKLCRVVRVPEKFPLYLMFNGSGGRSVGIWAVDRDMIYTFTKVESAKRRPGGVR